MMEFRTYDDKDDGGRYHGFQQDVYESVQRITHRANWYHGIINGYAEWINTSASSGEIVFYIR